MAENTTPTSGTPESETPARSGGMLSKLMVVFFMGGVVLTECMLAYLWIPTPDDVAARAQMELETETAEGGDPALGGMPAEDIENMVEVDIGDYHITAPQSGTNTTLRIDCHLFGTVLDADESEFATLYARVMQRFRDQIIFEIRNAELTDLTDPGLGLIKRRILEKSNKLFGKPIMKSIVVSEFSCMEQ